MGNCPKSKTFLRLLKQGFYKHFQISWRKLDYIFKCADNESLKIQFFEAKSALHAFPLIF
ncbi:MAG TPA: hypothetical protein DHV26_02460 [Cytophagales bacterium]|nr:hypothetical protein [Cytophagales bacterium]